MFKYYLLLFSVSICCSFSEATHLPSTEKEPQKCVIILQDNQKIHCTIEKIPSLQYPHGKITIQPEKLSLISFCKNKDTPKMKIITEDGSTLFGAIHPEDNIACTVLDKQGFPQRDTIIHYSLINMILFSRQQSLSKETKTANNNFLDKDTQPSLSFNKVLLSPSEEKNKNLTDSKNQAKNLFDRYTFSQNFEKIPSSTPSPVFKKEEILSFYDNMDKALYSLQEKIKDIDQYDLKQTSDISRHISRVSQSLHKASPFINASKKQIVTMTDAQKAEFLKQLKQTIGLLQPLKNEGTKDKPAHLDNLLNSFSPNLTQKENNKTSNISFPQKTSISSKAKTTDVLFSNNTSAKKESFVTNNTSVKKEPESFVSNNTSAKKEPESFVTNNTSAKKEPAKESFTANNTSVKKEPAKENFFSNNTSAKESFLPNNTSAKKEPAKESFFSNNTSDKESFLSNDTSTIKEIASIQENFFLNNTSAPKDTDSPKDTDPPKESFFSKNKDTDSLKETMLLEKTIENTILPSTLRKKDREAMGKDYQPPKKPDIDKPKKKKKKKKSTPPPFRLSPRQIASLIIDPKSTTKKPPPVNPFEEKSDFNKASAIMAKQLQKTMQNNYGNSIAEPYVLQQKKTDAELIGEQIESSYSLQNNTFITGQKTPDIYHEIAKKLESSSMPKGREKPLFTQEANDSLAKLHEDIPL